MALFSVPVIKDPASLAIDSHPHDSSSSIIQLQINVLWFLFLIHSEPLSWGQQMWGPEDTAKQIVLLLTITQNWGFKNLKCVIAGANWAYCFQQKNNIFHDPLSFLIFLSLGLPCCTHPHVSDVLRMCVACIMLLARFNSNFFQPLSNRRLY